MIQEIVNHDKIKFLANLWVVVLTLFVGFNMIFAASGWQYVGSSGFSSQDGMFISQAFDSKGTPYVVFEDSANSRKATVMKYAYNSATSKTEWYNVGSAGFSNGRVAYTTITFDSNDTPYVAFTDVTDNYKATVVKYDSSKSQWVSVGSTAFTPYQADVLTLKIDSNDVPYVAYSDNCTSASYSPPSSPCTYAKASVMKYAYNSATSKTEWHNVGSARFSTGWANFVTLALDKSDTPYIAFQDSDNSNLATVMKYAYNSATSKTEWHNVGSAGFSNGTAQNMTLKINSKGVPYVAYWYGGSSRSIDVMSYDTSSKKWSSVGSSSLPTGEIVYGTSSIVFDSSDTPYVLVGDSAKSFKLSVFKYDTSTSKWAPVGAQGFTNNAPLSSFLSINSSGVLHVGFLDIISSKYKVSVVKYDTILSPEKDILTFDIGTNKGKVNQSNHTILVKVSCTDDITKLTPAITISKYATISPKSGVAQDFTNPVTYTVTAEDGSKQDYVVTVYQLSCEKDILEFTGGNSTGTIDQTNLTIDLNVKCNIDIKNLEPTIIISKKATINPASNIIRDFTNPQTYTVTAEDGSTQTYTVTVNRISCEKQIIKARIGTNPGDIDQLNNTVNIGVPCRTDLTKLAPVFEVSDKATLNPTSGTYLDFTNPQKYTVTAADGSTRTYTVTVKKLPCMWKVAGNNGSTSGNSEVVNIINDFNNTKYVAFGDNDESDKATVIKYDGLNSWSRLGKAGFTPARADWISPAISSSGTVYVAFSDSANADIGGVGKASVMRYLGGIAGWVNIGTPGFSLAGAEYTRLALDKNDIPYVAFIDNSFNVGNPLTVMKYSTFFSRWVPVGAPGFSNGTAWYPYITFDNLNTPYVAYREQVSGKAVVMKFDGRKWVNVGPSGFTLSSVDDPEIAFDSNNNLFIAFRDWSQGGKVTVMKYDGIAAWIPVGTPGFSKEESYGTSLYIYNNELYVSFSYVAAYSGKTEDGITVMKYDSSRNVWDEVGQNPIASPTPYTDILVDKTGVPYVVSPGDPVIIMKFD